MNALFFSPVIERAMRLAARCHRHQNRKLSDLPYISHPASVALILSRSGFNDEEVLAAALLHDVVEDNDYTLDELSDRFPPKVAEYVAALTERKLDDAGRERPWLQRKQEHIEHVAGEPLEARAIILADKLHNLGTISYDLEARDSDEAREGIWRRFNATREQTLWYYRTMIERAAQKDERLEALASACRELLAKLETMAGDNPSKA